VGEFSLGVPCELWGFLYFGDSYRILLFCVWHLFGVCTCNCLCPIIGFLIYNTLLIKKNNNFFCFNFLFRIFLSFNEI
jgi:hypothetical protein